MICVNRRIWHKVLALINIVHLSVAVVSTKPFLPTLARLVFLRHICACHIAVTFLLCSTCCGSCTSCNTLSIRYRDGIAHHISLHKCFGKECRTIHPHLFHVCRQCDSTTEDAIFVGICRIERFHVLLLHISITLFVPCDRLLIIQFEEHWCFYAATRITHVKRYFSTCGREIKIVDCLIGLSCTIVGHIPIRTRDECHCGCHNHRHGNSFNRIDSHVIYNNKL